MVKFRCFRYVFRKNVTVCYFSEDRNGACMVPHSTLWIMAGDTSKDCLGRDPCRRMTSLVDRSLVWDARLFPWIFFFIKLVTFDHSTVFLNDGVGTVGSWRNIEELSSIPLHYHTIIKKDVIQESITRRCLLPLYFYDDLSWKSDESFEKGILSGLHHRILSGPPRLLQLQNRLTF